jgi:hypothetical protein
MSKQKTNVNQILSVANLIDEPVKVKPIEVKVEPLVEKVKETKKVLIERNIEELILLVKHIPSIQSYEKNLVIELIENNSDKDIIIEHLDKIQTFDIRRVDLIKSLL